MEKPMSLELTGIDGRNPVGFLAALGVVASIGGRLHWITRGAAWTPIVSDITADFDSPDALANELYRCLIHIPFAYRFASEGERPYDDFREKKAEEDTTSKRKQSVIRTVTEDTLRDAIEAVADKPDELERIAAHTCVVALRKEKPEITAVRSVSGQTRYLTNLRAIVNRTSLADLYRALFERWKYAQNPKLGLDPDGYVENVAWDVGQLGSISEIGAERLALEGLRGLPTSISRGRLVTRGYDREQRCFRWALSSAPRSFRASSDVLGSRHLHSKGEELQSWMSSHAIAEVNESEVYRYGQGYKTLRPAVRAS